MTVSSGHQANPAGVQRRKLVASRRRPNREKSVLDRERVLIRGCVLLTDTFDLFKLGFRFLLVSHSLVCSTQCVVGGDQSGLKLGGLKQSADGRGVVLSRQRNFAR